MNPKRKERGESRTAKQQHKNRCRVVRPNRAKHFQVCPSPSSGASNDTDFVMGRRMTRPHQVRARAHSMRLLPGALMWSESARGRYIHDAKMSFQNA